MTSSRPGTQTYILSMNITTNCDRSFNFKQVGFRFENLGGSVEDEKCLILSQSAFAVKVIFKERHIPIFPQQNRFNETPSGLSCGSDFPLKKRKKIEAYGLDGST